jgi:hypothetical protein
VKKRLVIKPLGGGRFVFDTVTVTPHSGIGPVRVSKCRDIT